MICKFSVFYTFCLAFVVLAGCTKYHYTYPKQHIEHKRYCNLDTLIIRDFVLCQSNKIYKQQLVDCPLNADSVLTIFKMSLQKAGAPSIVIEGGHNCCDSVFLHNRFLDVKKINQNSVLSMTSELEHKCVLVPIIYIDNRTTPMRFAQKKKEISIAGFYQRDVFLNMVFYIVCNDEIIYSRSGYFGAVSSETMTPYSKPGKLLAQKNWDGLTKKLLRKYVKQLK